MAITLFELIGKIAIKNQDANDAIDDTTDKASKAGSGITGTFKKVGAAVATFVAVDKIKDFGVSCIQAAADASAMEAQFSSVFGDLEGNASESLSKIADNAGISENRMKGSFTQIAAFAKTTGMDTESALGLSERAMVAVADSAAFYDRSLEDTTASLQSFLKGNYENDAALGLSCTETTRNAAANALYGKSFKDLSEEQKQLTLLQMVEDANAASGALGQAARESNTWTNKIGNLRQAWENFKAKLAAPVLEYVTTAVGWLAEKVGAAAEAFDAGGNPIQAFIDKISALQPWFAMLGGYIVDTFSPILSDLGTVFGIVKDAVQPLIDKIVDYCTNGQLFVDITDLIKGAMDAVTVVYTTAKDLILGIVQGFQDAVIWGKEHETALLYIGIALGTLTAAIGAYNIAMAIKNAGGIVEIAQLAATAIGVGALTVAETAHTVATTIATTATAAFGAVLSFLTSPITLVVVAIGALIAAGVALYQNWDTVKAFCLSAWEAIKSGISTAVDVVKNAISTAWEWIKTTTSTVWEGIKTGIGNVWNGIKTGVSTAIDSVKTGISTAWENIKTATSTVWNGIKGAIDTVWNGIKTAVSSAINTVKTIISTIWNAIKSTTSTVWNGIRSTISTVWTTIKSAVTNAVNAVKTKITTIWNNIKSTTSTVWNGLRSTISTVMTAVKAKVTSVIDGVKGVFDGISSFISDVFAGNWSSAWEGIKSTFTGMWDGISEVGSNIVTGVWDGISNKVDWIIEKIGGFCDSVWEKMKNFFGIHSPSTLMRDSIGKNLADGVAEGIDANTAKTAKAAERMGNTILEAAKKTLAKKKETTELLLADEVAYWAEIVKRTKEGTKARIAAEEQYAKVKTSLDEKLAAAEAEYQSAIDATIAKIKQRSDEILSAFKLFESWERGERTNADQLIDALETQVGALDEYQGEMKQLSEKIGETDLFEAVQAMGLESLEQVKAINAMTEEQLNKYLDLYEKRKQLADELAKSELADENAAAIQEAYNKFSEKCAELGVEITEATNQMAANVDTAFVAIVESVGASMEGVTTSVTNTMNEVPDSFGNAMESALDVVTSTLDKMKAAFESFQPKMKMPHFSITGELDIENGTVPEVSVEWYKKAMNNAMIMDKPTIFGYNPATGSYMGGGEAGSEVISGTDTLMGMIGRAVAANSAAAGERLAGLLEALLNAITGGNQEIVQALMSGQKLVVDRREFGRMVREYA